MRISSIPLIVLLAILFVGCIYYLRISRLTLWQAIKILIGERKINPDLTDKSLDELNDLLSVNRSLEEFEKCAQIRDEIKKREVSDVEV